jgi:hypothetical protein
VSDSAFVLHSHSFVSHCEYIVPPSDFSNADIVRAVEELISESEFLWFLPSGLHPALHYKSHSLDTQQQA